MNEIEIYWMANGHGRIPEKSHPTDAGWDLYVSRDCGPILPFETRDLHTDICIAMPEGWYGHIKTRSSTLVRYGLEVVDAVIDQGYRGELFIQVRNVMPDAIVHIEAGRRLAQIVFLPVPQVRWTKVGSLPNSARGTAGFGSSDREEIRRG